jgi:cysteinyl-tRNA synthetase
MVQNFFIKANDMLESTNGTGDGAYDVTATQAMEAALETAKSETFDALCDSFSTSTVMASISELITVFNSSDRLSVDINTIRKVATWVTSMVNTFGLNGSASSEATAIGWSGLSIPDAAKPYVYQLSEIRDRLRQKARSPEGLSVEDVQAAKGFGDGEMIASHKASNPYAAIASAFAGDVAATADSPTLSKDILQLCDRLRDVDLWCHGIYLEDRDGDQPALVRPVTRELLATRQEKDAREAQKQRARAERLHEAAARASRGQQSPVDMYRTAEYSEWDEDGMPTKDAEGKVVAKNQTKRLRKGWETQKKLHEAWVESRS